MKYVKGNEDKAIREFMEKLTGGTWSFLASQYYTYDPGKTGSSKIPYFEKRPKEGEEITIEQWKQEIGMVQKPEIINEYQIF